MRAWVIGGSGLIGRALVALLLERPGVEQVVSLGRRRSFSPHPKLEERVVDFTALERELAGAQPSHAFSCLGTTIKQAGSQAEFRQVDYDYPLAFGRAAVAAGVGSYLVVSALGANEHSSIFYNRVKGELERDLRSLSLSSLHLLRPSLLLGEREQQRPGERAAAVLSRPLRGLLRGPLARYAPIEGSDVARALVTLAEDATPGQFVHESDALKRLAGRLGA
ncbi:MAG: NAD-dependent epimerase/dehydratase family protein [Polyangiaceae bacterium]